MDAFRHPPGQQHLRLILSEYTDHCNLHRPHRALRQNPPAGRAYLPAEVTGMRVLRRTWLGALIHEHAQVAWGDIVSGTRTLTGSPRP